MHPEDSPECGQNASPRGKQTSLTLLSKAKENPTLVCVNTGRKIPKTSVENSPVLQAILIMAALSSGVLRP